MELAVIIVIETSTPAVSEDNLLDWLGCFLINLLCEDAVKTGWEITETFRSSVSAKA